MWLGNTNSLKSILYKSPVIPLNSASLIALSVDDFKRFKTSVDKTTPSLVLMKNSPVYLPISIYKLNNSCYNIYATQTKY